jgi:hypothetical protein
MLPLGWISRTLAEPVSAGRTEDFISAQPQVTPRVVLENKGDEAEKICLLFDRSFKKKISCHFSPIGPKNHLFLTAL